MKTPCRDQRAAVSLWAIAFVLVCVLFAVDGELSRAAALDRWVGQVALLASGVVLGFIVIVDPGKNASFEWRSRNAVVFSGPLSAQVSGSRVTGTLYPFGGTATAAPDCCQPCKFSGTISGNRVDGTLDPATCTSNGVVDPFFLVKQ